MSSARSWLLTSAVPTPDGTQLFPPFIISTISFRRTKLERLLLPPTKLCLSISWRQRGSSHSIREFVAWWADYLNLAPNNIPPPHSINLLDTSALSRVHSHSRQFHVRTRAVILYLDFSPASASDKHLSSAIENRRQRVFTSAVNYISNYASGIILVFFYHSDAITDPWILKKATSVRN